MPVLAAPVRADRVDKAGDHTVETRPVLLVVGESEVLVDGLRIGITHRLEVVGLKRRAGNLSAGAPSGGGR